MDSLNDLRKKLILENEKAKKKVSSTHQNTIFTSDSTDTKKEKIKLPNFYAKIIGPDKNKSNKKSKMGTNVGGDANHPNLDDFMKYMNLSIKLTDDRTKSSNNLNGSGKNHSRTNSTNSLDLQSNNNFLYFLAKTGIKHMNQANHD